MRFAKLRSTIVTSFGWPSGALASHVPAAFALSSRGFRGSVAAAVASLFAVAPIAAQAGYLYVAGADFNSGNGFIDQINLNTATPTVTTYATGLGGVEQIAVNSSGTIFTAESYSNLVGIYTIAPGGGTSTAYNTAIGNTEAVSVDSAGHVNAASNNNPTRIYANVTGSTLPAPVPGAGPGGYSQGITTDSAGNFYNVVNNNSDLVKTDSSGNNTTIYSGLYFGAGLLFDSSGNLFATDGGNNQILEFTAASLAAATTSAPASAAVFATGTNSARFLTFDPSGNLFVSGGSTVYKIAPGGGAATALVTGLNSNNGLSGIVYSDTALGAAVPEPASLSLIGFGALGLLARRRSA